jgi:hypothetical protein
MGFTTYDAMHIACAESIQVDIFLSTDKNIEKCGGEFSLMVLGYNFTRMVNVNILGVSFIRDYCVQRARNELKNVTYA